MPPLLPTIHLNSPGALCTILHFLILTYYTHATKINPDFDSKNLPDCEQKITINVLLDLKEIELDMAEMRIEKCYATSSFVKIENLKLLTMRIS